MTTTISHHVFIDFENVQNLDLMLLKSKPVELLILLGANQHHLPIALVKQLMQFQAQAQLIELNVSGKNALDFVLACYVGQFTCKYPQNNFYIISKDKGYDPLIKHLQAKHIKIQRHDELTEVSLFKQPTNNNQPIPKQPTSSIQPNSIHPASIIQPLPKQPTTIIQQRFDYLISLLKQSPRNRPAKRESLVTFTDSAFAKKLSAGEVANLIYQMQQKQLISFGEQNKVNYHL